MAAISNPEPALRFHPLLIAGGMLAADLISTLAYAAILATTHDLRVATVAGVGAGLAGIGWSRLRGRAVDLMQWLSLGLVIVFGGVGLMLHDARFAMIKPTVIYIAVGAVMLKPGWLTRYMPVIVRTHGSDLVRLFEGLWASMMFLTAALNGWLAARGDVALWASFVAVVPIASKAALFGVQYLAMRLILMRRLASRERSPA